MTPIKVNRLIAQNWLFVGATMSKSASWGFDRLRLYYPTDRTEVALFSRADYNAGFKYINSRWYVSPEITPTYGHFMFSLNNSFEHSFSFDLSGSPAGEDTVIMMRGIKRGAEFQQIYAWPTGYSASMGRNADLNEWDFSAVNVGENVGGVHTSIIMRDNPNLSMLRWLDSSKPERLLAQTIDIRNCSLNDSMVTRLLDWTDAGGVLNGTLNYSGNSGVPFERCWENWNNLINKGWTITGNQPSGTNPNP